jgi:hypothetical protein|tara:strand:+ start:715 stop:993 length:279 start_codon:yes stop_codon:yes gene_type:complete
MDDDLLNVVLFVSGLCFFLVLGAFVVGLLVGRDYLKSNSKAWVGVAEAVEVVKPISRQDELVRRGPSTSFRMANVPSYPRGQSRKLVIPIQR